MFYQDYSDFWVNRQRSDKGKSWKSGVYYKSRWKTVTWTRGNDMSGCHYFATLMYLDRYMTNQTCTALKSLQNVTLCLVILDKARASAVQTLSWDPDGISSRVSVLPRLESWVLGCNPGLEIFESPIWF